MSVPAIGAAVTIKSDCTKCCPRRVKIFCCCCKVQEDDQDQAERVQEVAKTNIPSNECHHHKHSHKKKVSKK